MGRHFGDGCNTQIFWSKHILHINRCIFGQVESNGLSYHCGNSIFPLIVYLLKHKTFYLVFSMTAPQAILAFPETSKVVKQFHSKIKFVWIHPTCIILHFFHLKPLPVHNFEVIVLVTFWLLLGLHSPAPTTGFLSEIYHYPILEGTVSISMFCSLHQV